MADLTEAERSPSTLLWHARVVEVSPHSANDRMALARAAVLYRDFAVATNALDGVDQADRHTVAYQNLAGSVAAAAHNLPLAQSYFQEAVRLDPRNPAPQLNLAVLQIHGTNAATVAGALRSLEAIAKNPTNSGLRCEALRELILNAGRNKQADVEVALCRELIAETNSTFSDRLLELDVLRKTHFGEYSSKLAALQQEAGSQPQKLQELATWQMARISPAETQAWLKKLPAKTLTNQPAATLYAETAMMAGDWSGLQSFLKPLNWAELEFIRHALLSRALREQGLAEAGNAEWALALSSANGEKQPLIMLLRLTSKWKWLTESEELLWNVVNQYPSEKWAYAALETDLFLNGRTRPLMSLYTQAVRRAPSDEVIKNNLAMTALLLEANELAPYKLAREVYDSNPTNASFASTYAYALHLQDKNAEALKVFQRLSPEQLEAPSIAGYYGLVLQSTGNRAKARKYLKLTAKARLLPEERRLFDRASVGS